MASRREETSDSEEESSLSLSDNENLAPPNKKRRGRKAQWRDCHVADMVDVICLIKFSGNISVRDFILRKIVQSNV